MTTTALFRNTDLKAVCDQKGATGRALVNIMYDGGIHAVAVGKDASGYPMTNPNDLVAIPCPPECGGGKKTAYTTPFTPGC